MPDSPDFEVRRATAGDAPAIGAVFDAAVRAGWTYLGGLAQNPMFPAGYWDQPGRLPAGRAGAGIGFRRHRTP